MCSISEWFTSFFFFLSLRISSFLRSVLPAFRSVVSYSHILLLESQCKQFHPVTGTYSPSYPSNQLEVYPWDCVPWNPSLDKFLPCNRIKSICSTSIRYLPLRYKTNHKRTEEGRMPLWVEWRVKNLQKPKSDQKGNRPVVVCLSILKWWSKERNLWRITTPSEQ